MEFSGPPKPSRVALPSLVNLSERLENANVESLPALADEVAQGQKHQLAELQNRLSYLEQIKGEYAKAHSRISSMKSDIRKVERKIFMAEDEIDEKKKAVQRMHCDFSSNLKASEKLRLTKIKLESKLKADRRLFEKYRAQMVKFKTAVVGFYENSETSEASKDSEGRLRATQCRLESLGTKEHRERLLNGQVYQERETILQSLEEQEQEIKAELISLHQMILEEDEKRAKIKQGTELIQKRNAAQLMRIRRQLQEGNTRTKTLEEEILQLENRISQVRSSPVARASNGQPESSSNYD